MTYQKRILLGTRPSERKVMRSGELGCGPWSCECCEDGRPYISKIARCGALQGVHFLLHLDCRQMWATRPAHLQHLRLPRSGGRYLNERGDRISLQLIR